MNTGRPNTDPAQPSIDDGMHGDGQSDFQTQNQPAAWPANKIAYGGTGTSTVKDMAYGGNKGGGMMAITNRIYKLERGYPRLRKGVLLSAIPRTKAETIYAKDTGQALQNKVLNTGATGTGTSGIPVPGTINKANTTTGAINRYRTTYKTNLQ